MWGSGSQDLGSQDMVAKMMKKYLLLYEKEILKKHNIIRRRFVDIGLENIAVAAARVVEGPSRCSLKVSKASMYIKPKRNSLFSPTPRREVRKSYHQP